MIGLSMAKLPLLLFPGKYLFVELLMAQLTSVEALLDSKTILTAAHCEIYGGNYIMVGKVNRLEGQNIEISQVIDGDWNRDTMDNDISILKSILPLVPLALPVVGET